MKRTIIAATLVAALAGAMSAAAEPGPPLGTPPPMGGTEWGGPHGGPGGFLERMTRELGLSDSQEEQIREILKAEFDSTEPLRQKMRDGLKQIRDASTAVPFDETAVRAAAARQAEVQTEMIVSHARVRSQIHAVLTAEQRVKATALEERMEQRMRKGPPPRTNG